MNTPNHITIAIDGNEANVSNRVGVSVVTFELLQNFKTFLSHEKFKNIKIIVYLREKPLPDLPAESKNWSYKIIWGPRLWLNLFLPLHIFFHPKPDVYLAPAHYTPPWPKLKIITIIHDLAFLLFPHEFLKKDLYTLTNWTKRAIDSSRVVIAVSNSTKQDLISHYHLTPDRVILAHNGFVAENTFSLALSKPSKKCEAYLTSPYILFVGTLQTRKNIPVLLKAFHLLRKDYPKLRCIIAGKKGWLFEEIFAIVKQLDLIDSVIFTDFISDSDKNILYQHASCFVLPSKYEGFGMPILEAMSNGCPVVAANNSSLIEVGGDAALFADTDSPASFAAQINLILADSHLRSRLIEKGKKQVKQYSFLTMASIIWERLLAVASNK